MIISRPLAGFCTGDKHCDEGEQVDHYLECWSKGGLAPCSPRERVTGWYRVRTENSQKADADSKRLPENPTPERSRGPPGAIRGISVSGLCLFQQAFVGLQAPHVTKRHLLRARAASSSEILTASHSLGVNIQVGRVSYTRLAV